MIEARGLSKRYGEVKAVDAVTFSVGRGEVVGFLGPNGAGKTTTLKMLSGLLYPTAGEARVLGHTPSKRERDFLRDARVDVAAFWRHLGKPLAHSTDGTAWVLGAGAADRAAALRSLEAPDFTLPDRDGRPHTLSAHRGTKVLLVSWASW